MTKSNHLCKKNAEKNCVYGKAVVLLRCKIYAVIKIGGMIVKIKVSGFEEKEEKLTLEEEKSGLLSVSKHLFNKVVVNEREHVLMRLMGWFKGLRYEDLEEVIAVH